MVTSASMGIALHYYNDSFFFARRHLLNVSLGLCLFFIALKVPIRFWRRSLPLLYLLSFLTLLFVFIPGIGVERNGAHRWIKLGPFLFQSSELAKLFVVIYFASVLTRRPIRSFIELRHVLLLPSALILLILIQPNFSTAMLLSILIFVLLFVGHTPPQLLCKVVILVLLLGSVLVLSSRYRAKRLIGFLFPHKYKQSINYQTNQSLLAIGSGGLTGAGLGRGKQKFLYLPQPHTDFMFAVVGEELGLIGTSCMILLFLLFALRSFALLHRLEDPFAQYVAFGLTMWLLLQAFIHIAVTLQVGPATGVPLPFVSYGGSSTIFNLLAAAILIRSLHDGRNKEQRVKAFTGY